MNETYIIGHRSPDLDSVASAISYAVLKNNLENTNKYIPAVFGSVNKETDFILNEFAFEVPQSLDSLKDKDIILVDHNEFIQAAEGIEEANILEVLDHHKIDFKYSKIIPFRSFPAGSTCSIIFDLFIKNNVSIDKNLAGLMLGAILIDTVLTKSPTSTEKDKEIIEELSKIAEIDDWEKFGMDLFKVRSNIKDLSVEEIIKSDFKNFEVNGKKILIGQVETADLKEFEDLEEKIFEGLEKIRNQEGYNTTVLFITDIINEGSKFIISTDSLEKLEEVLEKKLENNKIYLPGVMSRKKQVTPIFEKLYN